MSPCRLTLVELPGVGHTPYKGIQTDVDTTLLAWQFVQQFPQGDVPPSSPRPPAPPPLPARMPPCQICAELSGTSLDSEVIAGVDNGDRRLLGVPE